MIYESDQDGRARDRRRRGRHARRRRGRSRASATAPRRRRERCATDRRRADRHARAGRSRRPSASAPRRGHEPSSRSADAGIVPTGAGRQATRTERRRARQGLATGQAHRAARAASIWMRVSGSGPGGRIVKADVARRRRRDAGAAGHRRRRRQARHDRADGARRRGRRHGAHEGVTDGKGETITIELSRTAADGRAADGRVEGHDPRLHAADRRRHGGVRRRCARELKRLARPAVPRRRERAAPPEAPTYNDMVVKACALALREHPRANGSYRDGRLQLHSRVNVGVASAAEDALVVPTVFDADAKSLGEIARETRALAERVRDGAITPPELGRRDVHRLEPRHVRGAQLHRDHQPAAGRDPLGRLARAARRRARRRGASRATR